LTVFALLHMPVFSLSCNRTKLSPDSQEYPGRSPGEQGGLRLPRIPAAFAARLAPPPPACKSRRISNHACRSARSPIKNHWEFPCVFPPPLSRASADTARYIGPPAILRTSNCFIVAPSAPGRRNLLDLGPPNAPNFAKRDAGRREFHLMPARKSAISRRKGEPLRPAEPALPGAPKALIPWGCLGSGRLAQLRHEKICIFFDFGRSFGSVPNPRGRPRA